MVGSIDPRCETLRGTQWPVKVASVSGTRVAENHLGQRSPAASTGRTYGCKRSDQTSKKLLRHGGRPHMGPRVRGDDDALATNSIQRNPLRIAAHVRRRIERLAVDRPVVVFAPEGRIADIRREGVVLELAVARQHFGAGVEPGARGDVDAGVRPLLVGSVRSLRAVNDAAVLVVFRPGLGAGGGRT